MYEQSDTVGASPSKPWSSYFFNVINQECIQWNINATVQRFFSFAFTAMRKHKDSKSKFNWRRDKSSIKPNLHVLP